MSPELENTPDPNSLILEVLERHIKEVIHPNMDLRRKRDTPLTAEEITDKIHRLPLYGKPGEEFEFEEQIRRDIQGVDGTFASEIADLVYYTSHPNCPIKEADNLSDWLSLLGIPEIAAYEFCIIKYQSRMKNGDKSGYKELEYDLLQKFIDSNFPDLKSIWEDPNSSYY